MERRELRSSDNRGVLLGCFLTDVCLYVGGNEFAVGCAATLGYREGSLKLRIMLHHLIIEQFREIIAKVVHIGNRISLNSSTQVHGIYGAQAVVCAVTHYDGSIIVEVQEVLVANVESTANGAFLRCERHLA